jgi:hypothetical protein
LSSAAPHEAQSTKYKDPTTGELQQFQHLPYNPQFLKGNKQCSKH